MVTLISRKLESASPFLSLSSSSSNHRPQDVRKCTLRCYAFPAHPGVATVPILPHSPRPRLLCDNRSVSLRLYHFRKRDDHPVPAHPPRLRQHKCRSFNGKCSALKINHLIDDTGIALSSWADFNGFAKYSPPRTMLWVKVNEQGAYTLPQTSG